MNGSVRAYPTQSGDRWEFTLELGTGSGGRRAQVRRRGFPTEQAAVDAMQAELTDRRRGQFIEPLRTTVRAYLDEWLIATAGNRRGHSTLSHRTNLKRIGILATVPLGKLQPHQVQLWVNELATRYAPRTVRATLASLDIALGQAVRWGHIPRNPAHAIGLPPVPSRRESPLKAWTATETGQFLAVACGTPHEALWRVLLDGQLRIGEARALRWDDLDLDSGTIRIRRTVTRTDDGKRITGAAPKTTAGIRDVVVSAPTVAALRRHRAAQLALRLATGPAWHETGCVFASGRGTALGDGYVREQLDRAIVAASVPRLTPHGLRHTGATLLILAGVPLVVVSRRLGHASIMVTADIYAHVTVDADRSASEAFARAISG